MRNTSVRERRIIRNAAISEFHGNRTTPDTGKIEASVKIDTKENSLFVVVIWYPKLQAINYHHIVKCDVLIKGGEGSRGSHLIVIITEFTRIISYNHGMSN